MDKNRFNVLLPLKVEAIIDLMIERKGFSFRESLTRLYNSQLYRMLEEEETKVWYYSPMLLFSLVDEELSTGQLELPDHV